VHDKGKAFARACETQKLPLGVFYVSEQKESFEDSLAAYESDKRPLYKRQPDLDKLQKLINSF